MRVYQGWSLPLPKSPNPLEAARFLKGSQSGPLSHCVICTSKLLCYVNRLQSPSWIVPSIWSPFSYIHSRQKKCLGSENEIALLKFHLPQLVYFLSSSSQAKWLLLSPIKNKTPLLSQKKGTKIESISMAINTF